jgi:hypothetical protein
VQILLKPGDQPPAIRYLLQQCHCDARAIRPVPLDIVQQTRIYPRLPRIQFSERDERLVERTVDDRVKHGGQHRFRRVVFVAGHARVIGIEAAGQEP